MSYNSAGIEMQIKPTVVLFGIRLQPTYKLLKDNKFKVFLVKHKFWNMKNQNRPNLFIIYVEDKSLFELTYKKLAEIVKKKYSKSKVMFCGPLANKFPWEILFESVGDFVCLGDDDEDTILELCQNFDNTFMYQSIVGLGYKSQTFFRRGSKPSIFLGNKRPKGLNIGGRK